MDPSANSAKALKRFDALSGGSVFIKTYRHVPFGRYILEFRPIRWVHLRAESSGQDELSDAARKAARSSIRQRVYIARSHHVPRQECVEREVGNKNAVEELDNAGQHEEYQERVDRLESC